MQLGNLNLEDLENGNVIKPRTFFVSCLALII